jgi:hypothetical protein
MATLPRILFLACVAVGIWCFTGMVIHAILVVQHRKPGCPPFPTWYQSPFNYLFKPDSLTEQGLHSRRRVLVNLVGFVAAWAIGIAIAVVYGS